MNLEPRWWTNSYHVSCGNTFAIHETHYDSKINDSVETTDNPFNNETTFLSTDSRALREERIKANPDLKD